MKLNFFERLFIRSPVRPLIQRHLEARKLLDLGGTQNGGHVLEIGCGPGGGIELIDDLFKVASVHAFDLDFRMIGEARRRRRNGRQVTKAVFWTGNARQIPVADNTYDAVFNFGAIHHIVDWRAALEEVRRLLMPGGRFYCEEILKYYITHPFWGRLMDHPQEDRFDRAEFIAALKHTEFQVRGVRDLGNLYLWVIADKPGG